MIDKYIEMRNKNVVDLDLLYTYATDKGMTLSQHSFMVGSQFLNYQEVLENIDKEFNLTRIYDKDGKFIKVIQ